MKITTDKAGRKGRALTLEITGDFSASTVIFPGMAMHLEEYASFGGTAVAELRCEPTNYTAGAIAADPRTTFITSAYTIPSERNSGVASALLAQLLAHAHASGCERCVTDFESANLPGARFWMRHFRPITFSVLRYVDERALYAHAERQAEDIW